MTTIDQRLLVPIAQTVVWDYISNINNNPSWQADCQSISFLSSKHEGQGTRWRYTTQKGRESVVEITAWYNGLGYEYVFIDGPRYRNNRGRIRLQEIAEGTIVQWTFSFETSGMFSGLRSASRQIENTMAASLKTLYRQVKTYATESDLASKSLMRDAPDVEARAQYKPRHPTVAEKSAADTEAAFRPPAAVVGFNEPPITDDDGQALQAIEFAEPPIEVDDTRPRPAVTGLEGIVPASDIPPDMDGEPEFLADVSRFEPPRRDHDTQPHPKLDIVDQEERAEPSEDVVEQPALSLSLLALETAPVETKEVDVSAEVEGVRSSDLPVTEIVSKPVPKSASPTTEVHIGSSIWDVFGVQRPSETGEMKAVSGEESEPVVMSATSVGNASRQGLRIRLRRNLVHLRRPL